MRGRYRILEIGMLLVVMSCVVRAADWPQLQHDAQRTGFTWDTMRSNCRARWIWFGTETRPDKGQPWILRNTNSKPGDSNWTDNLNSVEGVDLYMPMTVSYGFSLSMQPIVVSSRVFVGDAVMGKVFAIALDDGSTLWTADNPGGAMWPGVATDSIVAFGSMRGFVTAWNAATGAQIWQVDTGRSITSAPALDNGVVYVASQNGSVYAINLANGTILWQRDTGAPIVGGLCVFRGYVYTVNEAMYAVAINATTGVETARSARLTGQSARFVWPVGVGNYVLFHVVPVEYPGSEYVMNNVLGAPNNFAEEMPVVRSWLAGSGSHWETTYALRYDTLTKDYRIPHGALEGCGAPPNPCTLDKSGMPLYWWATEFPKFTKVGAFGTNFSCDIVKVDMSNGNGIQIDNGKLSGSGAETDNMFGMTVGSTTLFLRQDFRGTKAIRLDTSDTFAISAKYRWWDWGGWMAPLNYCQGIHHEPPAPPRYVPATAQDPGFGRTGPTITNQRILFTETFCVTCMEGY